jgi:hypothetical protein
MKGPSLQKQYSKLTEKGNRELDIELQTVFQNNIVHRHISHDLFNVVINEHISECDLWAIKGRYFISCDQIMKIDIDIF